MFIISILGIKFQHNIDIFGVNYVGFSKIYCSHSQTNHNKNVTQTKNCSIINFTYIISDTKCQFKGIKKGYPKVAFEQ